MNRAGRSVRDTLRLVVSHAGTSVSGLVFLTLATRWLSAVEIAALAAVEVLVGALRVVSSLGLVGTIMQRVPPAREAGDEGTVRAYIRLAVFGHAGIVVPLAIALTLFTGPLSSLFFDSTAHGRLMLYVLAATLSGRLFDQSTLVLGALDRFRTLSACRIGRDLVVRTASILVVPALGVGGLFATTIAGELLLAVVITFVIRHDVFGSVARIDIPATLRYSAPFYLNGFCRFGILHVDQIVVSALLGPEALATYFVARRIYVYLEAFANHFVAPIVPKLSALRRMGRERMGHAFRRSSRFVLAATVPVALSTAAAAGPALDVLGGGRYVEATAIVVALSGVAILFALAQLHITLVFVAGRPSDTLRLNLVGGIAGVVLAIALGIPFGLLGVAISRGLAIGLTAILGRWIGRRFLDRDLEPSFLARVTARAGLPILACGLYLANLPPAPMSGVALGLAFLAGVYLAAGALAAEDRAFVRTLLPARLRAAPVGAGR